MKANVSQPEPPSPESSFRLFLQSDLARRCAKSPKYSLRSHAQHLGIDHATLSQLLRGRRVLTERTIRELGERLGATREQVERWIEREEASASGSTASGATGGDELRQLAHDTAVLISDPFHYAILELTRLESFEADSRWVARVLGSSVDEVNIALQRLLRLGLLEMQDERRWVDRTGAASASLESFPRVVVERLHAQVQALALRALQKAPRALRTQSSTTLAVNTARVPAVLARIERFRQELTALLESDAPRDDVYQLEIAFFPITSLQEQP